MEFQELSYASSQSDPSSEGLKNIALLKRPERNKFIIITFIEDLILKQY